LLILLGLLIAISGALAAVAYVAGSPGGGQSANATPTPTAEPTIQVVVASTKINAGTVIDKTMVKLAPRTISDIAALGGATYSATSDVIGKIASGDIAQDQILVTGADLLTPGAVVDGKSLSDSIDKGFVGISMEMDQTNGVGTLIVPGDRVDIILTLYVDALAITAKDAAGTTISTSGSNVSSKLILENCKIIATLLPPAGSTGGTTQGGNGSPAPVSVPTLPIVQFTGRHMIAIVEVLPDQAQVIRWAQRAEAKDPQTYIDMAFALRSSQDNGTVPLSSNPFKTIPGITFTEIVQKYGVLPPDPLSSLPTLLGNKIQW
jgi:Flp pilus assembly protein CpaB